MRTLISLLFLGLTVFLVAGWFLDWYDVSKVKSDNGKSSYQVDFNRDKIKGDLKKGTQKFNETIEKIGEDQSKSAAPHPTASSSGGWSPVPR